MPVRPWSRPVLAVAAAGLLGVGLVACASSDDDDGGGRGPDGDAANFRAEAAMACTEVLNERPADFTTGVDVMLEVFADVYEGTAVDADEVDIEAVRAADDEIDRTAERLAEVDTDGATATESAAREDVFGAVDERGAGYDARLAAVEAGDPDEIAVAFEPISPAAMPDEALEDLGLGGFGAVGRDCSWLLEGGGAGGDTFHAEAATACAVALQAERDGTVAEDREAMMNVVSAAVSGTLGEVSDADHEAVDRLADALRTTADEIAEISADGGTADDWGTFVAAVEERAASVERRAEALDGGSDDDIASAFEPGAGAKDQDDPRGALERLGLDRRECGLIY